ncbi:MAG TPA: NADH-quinone oxidoreductase subunit L, partial [Pirellulales bacterium]|nr:NADH-quinone oxidoreductase subunit L [Pirellulales bacterium]
MPDSMRRLLMLIPALPLAAAILTALFGRVLGNRGHLPVVFGILGSFVASVALLSHVVESSRTSELPVGWEATTDLWNWVNVGDAIARPAAAHAAGDDPAAQVLPASLPFRVEVTLRADALTAIMLAMVTFVSSLVAIYSCGYMHGDRGYWRFFTYIGLFVFSMTMLVSVSNFVLLYVFWEAVGLCSYFLIGFWYEKPSAVAAGKKAFLVNRVGDFGFALGLFLLWTTYGTLNFHDAHGIAGILGQTRLADPDLYVGVGAVTGSTDYWVATAICLLLMLGACGKSAQFPLHVWLPDAMEGPTPVSALIHAATMVTAGVYMVTRCTPLFAVSSDAQRVVALIGLTTAVIGGVIAITQTDLKRVLAYSTISQLGYMFLGLGVGTLAGISAGMFHLFTHAFFKALLFLGAGSVMHAMGGVVDMRRFGGLRRLMPTTHWTFLFGCLALAAVIPFAGFWSKDAIMIAVHDRSEHDPLFIWLYWGGLAVAFLTSMYTFRAFFLTFYGDERVPYEAGDHAHESPRSMTLPLVALAWCALGIGAYFEWTQGFHNTLLYTPSLAYESIHAAHDIAGHASHLEVITVSTIISISGVGLAAFLYLGDRSQVDWIARALFPLYLLSYGKLFFDPIYQALFVWPLWLLARLSAWFDRTIVDGLVNLVGRLPPKVGGGLRALQSGMAQ